MSLQLSPTPQRRFALQAALLAALITLCGTALMSGTAQSVKEERKVEDKIPAHLPIKVKVKNPDKALDLKNEKWLGDLEVEVTNRGSKPIYYLSLSLRLPEVKGDQEGSIIGYQLRYGRIQLVDLTAPILADDVPLLPGESHTFKVAGSSVGGWKLFKSRKNIPDPKRIELIFQLLNHGDQTGFRGPDAVPLPNYKKQGANVRCLKENRPSRLMTVLNNAPPEMDSQNYTRLLQLAGGCHTGEFCIGWFGRLAP